MPPKRVAFLTILISKIYSTESDTLKVKITTLVAENFETADL